LKAKEESKYRRKIVQTLFDMTPVRVAVGVTGMNVGDTYETVNSIAEGIGDITQLGLETNVMSDYDLFVLKKSLEASASKADQIASKWEGYESAESGPIMPYPEQLALEVMGIFAKLSLDAQQAAWEKLAPPEIAAKMFPDDKRRILQRGARSADPASVAYIDAVEAAIARYEARIKNSEAKITGANQPEMDPSKTIEHEATPMPTPIPANEEPIDVQR
jgi:hypothetical protein